MLLPAVIYIVLLVGIPFVMAILFSFSDVTIGSPQLDHFTLDTFTGVINDPIFQRALGNTFWFTIASQVITIVLANILALVLMQPFRGKWLVRLLILLPWATPIAIGAIGWLWMLDSVYSPVDWIFRQFHLLGVHGVISNASNMYWLGIPNLAVFSVIMVQVWRMLPMATVIIMAGLVVDFARYPGCCSGRWSRLGWRELRFVSTLPLLLPIILVALLFGIVFTFTDMTVIYVLTGGGTVNSTQVLASWAFFKGIQGGDLAAGAATVIFMLPVLMGVALLMLRLAKRSEVN